MRHDHEVPPPPCLPRQSRPAPTPCSAAAAQGDGPLLRQGPVSGSSKLAARAQGRRAVQYIAPDGTEIDILARLGEAFRFDDLRAETRTYGDVQVRSASAETLYRMKRDTVGPQDRVDAEVLKDRFKLEDG